LVSQADAAGIAHCARYPAYSELVRAETFRATGVSDDLMAACNLHTAVREAVVQHQVRLDSNDLLQVETRLLDLLHRLHTTGRA
jgi:acyl-CoA thioesterase FadM